MKQQSTSSKAFTIVELLIVLVVIGILAGVVIVAFNGVRENGAKAVLQSDLRQAASSLEASYLSERTYPDSSDALEKSEGTIYEYTVGTGYFCLTASSDLARTSYYYDTNETVIKEGTCPGHNGYSDVGPWTYLNAGAYSSCGISSGKAYCWGSNFNGVLGDGTTTSRVKPTPVVDTGVLSGRTIEKIDGGYGYTCALADGAVYCWGGGANGVLGNGSTANSSVPVAVTPVGSMVAGGVTDITVGGMHACALAAGRVFCWGSGTNGSLGQGSFTNSSTPVEVVRSGAMNNALISQIEAGWDGHTCAIANGEVYCWGYNYAGAIGNNDTSETSVSTPVKVVSTGVLAGKTVTELGLGASSSCAIADGQAFCWGYNGYYTLGIGQYGDRFVPVAVTASQLTDKSLQSVTGGFAFHCLLADEQPFCWGKNDYGENGNGTNADQSTPRATVVNGVVSSRPFEIVSAGYNHTCGLAEGRAFCWGRNTNGQLGNGTTTSTNVPVRVNPVN